MTCLSPGTGKAVRLLCAVAYAAGATVADIEGQKNDGSVSLFRVGGVGTGVLNQPTIFEGGLIGYKADASKLTLTATGASASELTVVYDFVNV